MANYSHDETLKAYVSLIQEHPEWFSNREIIDGFTLALFVRARLNGII